MNNRSSRLAFHLPGLVLFAAASLLATAPARASTVVSCAFSGTGGDQLFRGIVVPSYPGNNVRLVQLGYGGSTPGIYRITLQIRRGRFDGPLVGAAATAYLDLPSTSAAVAVYFDFGGAPVTAGDTLTFTQTYSGPGTLFYDVGNTSCAGAVYQTEGTTPPLDTLRRDSVGIAINQDDLIGGCIPNDTILCIDNVSGDRRFKATLNFSHAGGSSGAGQAIPMASLGIAQGGTFWFFGPNNPEVLLKVLNACGVDGHFWLFATAGTSVAFTLDVLDTSTAQTKTYTNQDNTAAQPIQDTSAFLCP